MVHVSELVPCFVLALLGGLLHIHAQDIQKKNAYGFVGTSLTMECPGASAATGTVRWADKVWNNDRNPAEIFTSVNNPSRDISSTHTKKENYKVDEKFSLTIVNVSLLDAGMLFCEVDYNTTYKVKLEYKLGTLEQPDCMGVTAVSEGDLVSLTCQSKFKGANMPVLEWLKGTEKLPMDDNSRVKLAKMTAKFNAKPKDDGQMYKCRLYFLGTTAEKECHLTMDVKYAATNVLIKPKKTNFGIGEEVNCSADGNPVPNITWDPMVSGGREGKGWKTFKVPASALGKTVSYKCSATNTVQSGATKTATSDITILGQKALPPTPKPNTDNGNNKEVGGGADSCRGSFLTSLLAVLLVLFFLRPTAVELCGCQQRRTK